MTKRRPEPRVMRWLAEYEPELRLSVLIIAEARRGYEMRKAHAIKPMLENWLNRLEHTFADRIDPFDARDAHIYGQLAAQRTLGGTVLDIQLAAQAIARGIPVATRNTADFAWTGVRLVNPWGD